MTRTELWTTDQWTWREFIALLTLEFVFVMFVIKHAMQSMYTKWLENTLFQGLLQGLRLR